MRLFGKRRYGVAAFVALVLAWGSTFAAVKVGLEYAPPVLLVASRCLLAGVIMTGVALVWGGPANLRRDWRVFVFLAAFNVVLFVGFQTFAILHLPSGTAAVLIYLQPVLVGFLAWMFLGESLTSTKLVGLLLGFVGIVAVSLPSFTGVVGQVTPVGVLCGVASAFCWAVGTVGFKRYESRISTLWAVSLPFLAGGVTLTAVGLALEDLPDVSWTAPLVGSILYSALIGTSMAWLLYFGLVRAGQASRVASYVFVVPIVAIAIGALFFGETLGVALLAGSALVAVGVYLTNRTPRRPD